MTIVNKKIVQHIPKTAGMALRGALSWHTENIEYSTAHKPLKFKNIINNGIYSNYPVYAVLREPTKWYNSWWNYTSSMQRSCAITHTLHKYSNNMDTFIKNSLDLTKFFGVAEERIKFLKEFLVRFSASHLIFFFDNFMEITADSFNHQSIYEFYVSRQIDSYTHLYRFEDQLELFLRDIGFLYPLPKRNVTKYKDRLSVSLINEIGKKEETLYKLYNEI